MKKMTIEQENALRATAKRCNDELKAAMAQKPKPKFDSVSRPLLAARMPMKPQRCSSIVATRM